MIVDFLNILYVQPQEHLSQVWGTILEQKEAFEKVKQACLKPESRATASGSVGATGAARWAGWGFGGFRFAGHALEMA